MDVRCFVRCATFSVIIGALCGASSAHAGGLFIPDIGTRSLGRAGAYVASGDDPTALWYNPANLAAGRGLRFEIDLTLNVRSVWWQRAPDPVVQDAPFEPVDNRRAPPIPIPGLFAVWDAGVPGLALALGVYVPMNGTLRFSDDGPQRYTVVRSGSFVIFFHTAVAYQVTKWLRLGAGLFVNSVFFNQRLAVNLGFVRPEDPAWDVLIDVVGTQHFLVNGNFGLTLMPGAGVELGVSFFPGRRARARGTLQVEPREALASLLQVNGSAAEFEIDFPWLVRAGAAWRWRRYDPAGQPYDQLVVEADYVFEGWSSLTAIRIFPRNVSLSVEPFIRDFAVPDLPLRRDWRDTHSVRFGGEALLYRPLRVVARAGYYWESGAVRDPLVTVGTPDVNKHGIALGAGIELGHFRLSLSYSHVLYEPRTITASAMRLTNPLDPERASIIGNGDYRFSHDLVSLGLSGAY